MLGIFLNIKWPGYYSQVGIQIFESYCSIFHGNIHFCSSSGLKSVYNVVGTCIYLKKKKKKGLRFTIYKMYVPHNTNTPEKWAGITNMVIQSLC